ncbi:RNA polymerase III subunit C82 [Sorochytrium milnesiophthora]
MSLHHARLIKNIVGDGFGPLAKTGIPIATVRKLLVILIQQHLVSYAVDNNAVTYYRIVPDQVFARLRFPRFVKAARELYQDEGERVISMVLHHGILSFSQLEYHFDAQNVEMTAIQETFVQLVHDRFLVAMEHTATQSAIDKHIAREALDLAAASLAPTAKEIRDIRTRQLHRQEAEDEEYRHNVVGMSDFVSTHQKRKAGTSDANLTQSKAHKTFTVDHAVPFRVNYEKFNVHFRNQAIARFSGERLNDTAQTVMTTILSLVRPEVLECKTPFSRSFTALELNASLPPTIELRMDYVFMSNVPESQVLDDYLTTLEQDDGAFLVHTAGRNSSQYSVNFAECVRVMQMRAVESIIRERFGTHSARIFRLIVQKGKLEEKQVSKIAMLGTKDARQRCYELQHAGFLDLQEVPRSADRAPGRTIFLWYVDPGKLPGLLTDSVKQIMCNVLERRRHESNTRQTLLEKSQRTDVQADAQHLLSEGEQQLLQQYEDTMSRLGASLLRLDNVYMLLNDFITQ